MSGITRNTNVVILVLLAVGAGILLLAGRQDGIRPWDRDVAFVAGAGGFSAEGSVRDYKSVVRFNPESPEQALIDLTLNMRSTTTGFRAADEVALSEEFLDVERHPVAKLTASGAKPIGNGKYVMDAELTLKGITKSVRLPLVVQIKEGSPVLKGAASVNRLEFGVGAETYRGYALDKEVKLAFALVGDKLVEVITPPKP
ncbi:YceI family protein [Rhodomicrobium sp. Az07]|uniref:YceI family protein n=1 Tax=Rhodomicrobium sp. Az07 TaxID=2839034 RepID=UPI001BE6BD93|nr:YceI family protein [Rhodomicrobium sp. Az07]MBT3069874.1 YceI family protein [Rhodomicrobium sp. Az07]